LVGVAFQADFSEEFPMLTFSAKFFYLMEAMAVVTCGGILVAGSNSLAVN
jgi:hypothetical protein